MSWCFVFLPSCWLLVLHVSLTFLLDRERVFSEALLPAQPGADVLPSIGSMISCGARLQSDSAALTRASGRTDFRWWAAGPPMQAKLFQDQCTDGLLMKMRAGYLHPSTHYRSTHISCRSVAGSLKNRLSSALGHYFPLSAFVLIR